MDTTATSLSQNWNYISLPKKRNRDYIETSLIKSIPGALATGEWFLASIWPEPCEYIVLVLLILSQDNIAKLLSNKNDMSRFVRILCITTVAAIALYLAPREHSIVRRVDWAQLIENTAMKYMYLMKGCVLHQLQVIRILSYYTRQHTGLSRQEKRF
jgi:hypothetical protein